MDAETRFCVAWFEQYGLDERPYGEAEVLCTAKNTSFADLERTGAVAGAGGRVRLRRRDEPYPDRNPAADERTVDWECVQRLARSLTAEAGGGLAEAARLAIALGSRAERAHNLAYRLHAVCERKGWNAEALVYNILITSWPLIQSKIAELRQGEQSALPV